MLETKNDYNSKLDQPLFSQCDDSLNPKTHCILKRNYFYAWN